MIPGNMGARKLRKKMISGKVAHPKKRLHIPSHINLHILSPPATFEPDVPMVLLAQLVDFLGDTWGIREEPRGLED